MTSTTDTDRAPIRIVLGDANVLYPRVLRDYLLYAADAEIISIRWSAEILAELAEHLIANLPGFDATAARRLMEAMTSAFPNAEVDVDVDAHARVASLSLPDEDDRHVLAATVAAEAEILCTDNIKDFPAAVMTEIGAQAMTADDLLALLTVEFGTEMRGVHETVVQRFPNATDASTLAALRRADATKTAELIEALLTNDQPGPAQT